MKYMYLGCLEKPCIIIHCNAGLGSQGVGSILHMLTYRLVACPDLGGEGRSQGLVPRRPRGRGRLGTRLPST